MQKMEKIKGGAAAAPTPAQGSPAPAVAGSQEADHDVVDLQKHLVELNNKVGVWQRRSGFGEGRGAGFLSFYSGNIDRQRKGERPCKRTGCSCTQMLVVFSHVEHCLFSVDNQ